LFCSISFPVTKNFECRELYDHSALRLNLQTLFCRGACSSCDDDLPRWRPPCSCGQSQPPLQWTPLATSSAMGRPTPRATSGHVHPQASTPLSTSSMEGGEWGDAGGVRMSLCSKDNESSCIYLHGRVLKRRVLKDAPVTTPQRWCWPCDGVQWTPLASSSPMERPAPRPQRLPCHLWPPPSSASTPPSTGSTAASGPISRLSVCPYVQEEP
jgi:hypothetical protein